MPYLIDGHNLIAQMPGLSLSDPDDEVRRRGHHIKRDRSNAGKKTPREPCHERDNIKPSRDEIKEWMCLFKKDECTPATCTMTRSF